MFFFYHSRMTSFFYRRLLQLYVKLIQLVVGKSGYYTIFTVKIATDLACAQRRYPCNTSGFSRQCYSGPQGSHLPIYAKPLWFSVSFAKLRPSGPALNFLL